MSIWGVVIGERERANLVVATGRFSIYLSGDAYSTHTVMFYMTLNNSWLKLLYNSVPL